MPIDLDKLIFDLEDRRKKDKEEKAKAKEEDQFFKDLKDKQKERYDLTKEEVMDEDKDKARRAALEKLRGTK